MEMPASQSKVNWYVIIAAALLAVLYLNRGGCVSLPPPDPDPDPEPAKITQMTYVYEKDQNVVPAPVTYALNQLNDVDPRGIMASTFDQNTVTGNDTVPKQYAIALAAAQKHGMPCLVVQTGETVFRVVKDPRTEEDVARALLPLEQQAEEI